MGFGPCGVWPSVFWDLGFLHKHWRIILGKNFAFLFLHMNSDHAVKLASETREIPLLFLVWGKFREFVGEMKYPFAQ